MIRKISFYLSKYFPLLSLLFVIFFIISIFLIQEQKNKLLYEYENKLALLERYKSHINELQKIEKEYKSILSEYKEFEKKLFKEKNESLAYAEMLSLITENLERYNLKKKFTTNLQSESINSFKIIKILIRASGKDLRNILNFIYSIENNDKKFLFLQKVTIRVNERKRDDMIYLINIIIGGLWKRT